MTVYAVVLSRGVPPNVEYLSDFLKGAVDVTIIINEIELLGKMLARESIKDKVGPFMVEAIEKRLRDLKK